ncbi:MAG: Glycopeptide antibiotics resistance protein [Actinobacteria bacterium 66_15]|nr:MAG: Glycopeptide antibiotics resistance protein [Actinobacteria bacterium 66_15]
MIPSDSVLLPVIVALLVVSTVAIRRGYSFKRTFLLLMFVSYVGAVVAVTLFPLPIDPRLIADETRDAFLSNNFIPFATIGNAFCDGPEYFWLQVLGNVALLAPLGFLLPSVWAKARRCRNSLLVILASALGVEALQYVISAILGYTYRQVDVDDVMMNVVGGALGYLGYTLLAGLVRRWRRCWGRRHASAQA